MAEFLNQNAEPPMDGFNAMGKPIPTAQRQRGYETCKEMGLDSARAWECVNGTAEQLERDKPHEAQGVAMKHLDLTGAYRLMAVLLTPAPAAPADKAAREPVARLFRDTPNVQTVWHVEVPAAGGKWKLYQATTYPNSALMYLETTGERRRSVAPLVARNLTPMIRAAIEKARATLQPTGEPQ